MHLKNMLRVFALVCLFSSPSQAQYITLDSCQTAAEQNWPLFQQYKLLDQAKNYSLENVKKNYYPKIDILAIGGVIAGMPSIGGDSDANAQFVGLVQVNQTIYDGGITKNQKAITELNYAKQKAELDQSLLQVQERVQDLYFASLLLDQKIKVLQEFHQVLLEREKQIQIGVQNGVVLKSDLSEIKIAEIENRQNIENLKAKQNEFIGLLKLLTQLNIEADQLKEPQPLIFSTTQNYNRPEYQILDYQNNLLESERKMQNSFLLPKVGLMGIAVGFEPQLGLGPAETGGIALAGLSLAWGIDALYTNKSTKSLIDTKQQMLVNQRANLTQRIDFTANSLALQIENYTMEIKSAKEVLKLQSEIASTYGEKYQQGSINLSLYLDKLSAWNNSKTEVKSLLLSQQQAIYLYNLNTGKSL